MLTGKRNASLRSVRTHGRLWEYDHKRELFTLGAALFHENDEIVRDIWRTKPTPRKMYAAMKCESVEISGFLQAGKIWVKRL